MNVDEMKLLLIVESTMPHAMIYDIPNTSPTLGEARERCAMSEFDVVAIDSHPGDSRFRIAERERESSRSHHHCEDSQGKRRWTVGTAVQNFRVEAIGHDIRSTKFAKDNHADPLTNTDYKEPPIVCYESIPKNISVTLRTDEQRI